MIARFRLLVIAALVALAVVAASAAPPAAALAPTIQPWQSDACFTSACSWSSSEAAYVAGGDGISISDYLSGAKSWGGDVSKIVNTAKTIETQGADFLPWYETVPYLQTIALGSTAFAVGWKIGSTINTKWLHLAGVGLGTTQPCQLGGTITGRWLFAARGLVTYGYTQFAGTQWDTPSWVLNETDTTCGSGNRYEWKGNAVLSPTSDPNYNPSH